ncbi:glycosyl hydrolase [Chitinophaga cymbidii]|uniref:Beta-mannosidase-like galactose-binding domain-containing protein n=1 Tax=Chitinophaga cymbidii TaxID=1096750 RepID=A0A512RNH9_9BACT|nr:glycosyl hydrolase [Chitinophaga cymbidii]GEP97229.1 hypothetical protein CCY01nite_34890 [Chitinophaga cymbidii]
MIRITTLSMLLAISACATAQQTSVEQSFSTPPDSIRPSVYWYWMSDNISEEGVKKDLEAMAEAGIGRAFIGNIGYNPKEVPYGNVKLFSDEWMKITRTAIRTASEKNIEIGMFNSPGWSQSGGPWIQPSQSMRYLAGETLRVKGPQKISQQIPAPGNDFQDVAVIAFPAPAADEDDISQHALQIAPALRQLVDGNTGTGPDSTGNMHIDLQVPEDFTARSLVLYINKTYRSDVELQVRKDASWVTVTKFPFDRSNAMPQVGFRPYAPVSIAFPAVTGREFRLILSNSSPSGLTEIKLLSAPRIERFEEKQLAKMFQTPLPLWNEYQWPQQAEPENDSLTIDPVSVRNISAHLGKDGTLNWDVPAGEWIILRYGMLPTGVQNAPASPEGSGLEIDKINRAAMQHHYDAFIGKIFNSIPASERTSLKWVVADSYETGSQNWTDGMEKAFRQQYGYDPLPWLPVLSGRIVGTAERSNRFLWDLRRLVADRVAYEYVGGLRDVSHKDGLRLWLENYGHWGFPAEFLQYGGQADEIGGEFWNEGTLGDIECRAASSAAHIYGKNKVAAESFTAGGQAYVRYPALLKRRGDWSFTEGINHTLLHVFITQPYEERNPGVNVGFGTEFNRKNTWFSMGKAFIDYIRRCNFLLQQGKPVNDIAYFIGEDAPKMTGVRDPELPAGYSYDYINAEVILQRLSVQNGRLTLPDGMSYRMLVLPKLQTMRPEVLQKISELVKQGAVVFGPAAERSPSLQHYPEADKTVRSLAAAMWKERKYGNGYILSGMSIEEALAFIRLSPDVKMEGKDVLYAHRAAKDADYYFLSNQTDKTVQIKPTFRINGKQPEWWDAVTGQVRDLPEFTADDSSTTVPLRLEAFESGFVVFRKPASKPTGVKNFPAPALLQHIEGKWKVQFGDTTVILDTLSDWSKHPDEHVRDFSGTATYMKIFRAVKVPAGEKVFLHLGNVMVMAKVKLNGKDLGTVWTAPWKVDATGALREGENQLEIEVVNTWVNRLIGDSKLPEAERKTWSNVNPYKPESTYQSAGLLGPVKLEIQAQ